MSPGEHQCRGEEARTIMASHNNATGRDQREKKKKSEKTLGQDEETLGQQKNILPQKTTGADPRPGPDPNKN